MRLEFGCHIITYGDIPKTLKYGILAEKAGFDLLSLPDHLFHPVDEKVFKGHPWDVYTLLTAIGMKTEKIKLMPGVSDVLRRHPATVAHIISTLDQLTGGRAVLALGAGEAFHLDPIPDVRWDNPVRRLREGIHVIKTLWESEAESPAFFDGKYFKLRNAYMGIKPLKKVSILVGGYGPKMRKLIGELADGWLPWIESPKTYKKSFESIKEHAKRAGRNPEELIGGAIIFTSVSKDGDKAKEILTPRTKLTLLLRNRLLKNLGYEELAKEAFDLWNMSFEGKEIEKLQELSEKVPDEAVEAVTVGGTPEEAIEKIERYVKAGVNLFVALPTLPNFEETISWFEKEIIPYFKECAEHKK
jgi:phthiodiolone/phenolphthiodiolone dimycocerosates ketoreductase